MDASLEQKLQIFGFLPRHTFLSKSSHVSSTQLSVIIFREKLLPTVLSLDITRQKTSRDVRVCVKVCGCASFCAREKENEMVSLLCLNHGEREIESKRRETQCLSS